MQIELTDDLKLAMLAGSFAIKMNKQNCAGIFYSYTDKQPIDFKEAVKILECTARNLNPDEYEFKEYEKMN